MQNKLGLRFGCSCAFVPFSEFEKGVTLESLVVISRVAK